MNDGHTLLFAAGEASGDLYAGALAGAIRHKAPNMRLYGMGGANMAAAGVDLLIDIGSSSVLGVSEIVRQIPEFLAKRKQLTHWIQRNRPDVVVLIDFPGFNLGLGDRVYQMGVPVVYFVPPKAWAWRPRRAGRVARFSTKVISILPFEASFYGSVGAPVEYVGHPLIDIIQAAQPLDRRAARERLALDPERPVLGLLPGSRKRELSMLLPQMLGAASILRAQIDGLQLVLPVAPTVRDYIGDLGVRLPELQHVHLVHGDTYNVIRSCDVALAASGTVTLETAILGTPMVSVYRMADLTYRILRRLVTVQYSALPNLLADREIVPELLQEAATAPNMADAALRLLTDTTAREDQEAELARVTGLLGPGGAVVRAASIILEVAGK